MRASATSCSPTRTQASEPGSISSSRATCWDSLTLSILAVDGVTFACVATILLAGVDVFFRGKFEALLPEHHLTTTDSVDPPELVICDVSRIDPDEVADSYPDIPILGFTNHTDTAGLRSAHAAGFDQVLAKSALVERARELVDELLVVSE